MADFRLFTDWRGQPLLVNLDRVTTVTKPEQGGACFWFDETDRATQIPVRDNFDTVVYLLTTAGTLPEEAH